MKLDKNRIMDVLFYLCLLIILVWAYLKAAGYINTPVLIEILPYAGGIFAVGMLYQRFVNLEKEVEKNNGLIHDTLNNVSSMEKKITLIDKDVGYLRSDVEVLKNAILN